MNEWMFVVALVLGVPIALAIWLIGRAVQVGRRLEELSHRLTELEKEVFRRKPEPESERPPEPASAPGPSSTLPTLADVVQKRREATPVGPPELPAAAKPGDIPIAPPPRLGAVPPPMPEPVVASVPPPIGAAPDPAKQAPKEIIPTINWEQFMGVKLFAWAGGLALFLGVALFVKYSFDNNLVPPELRVALGFLAGLGLLVGGVLLSSKEYPALSQTLCATGVLILYAVTFACRSIYHFQFFGAIPTFLLMVLITTTAFLLAIRLNAQVVAILGMLGGFLTPILLSTGQDNPLGLFGYIAILDIGLILVSLHHRWNFLAAQPHCINAVRLGGQVFRGGKILR